MKKNRKTLYLPLTAVCIGVALSILVAGGAEAQEATGAPGRAAGAEATTARASAPEGLHWLLGSSGDRALAFANADAAQERFFYAASEFGGPAACGHMDAGARCWERVPRITVRRPLCACRDGCTFIGLMTTLCRSTRTPGRRHECFIL